MNSTFESASDFDQDISTWIPSSVINANNMFKNATSYNQDLSGLYFSSVTSEPTSFSTGASSWALPKPQYNNGGVPTTITT
jgi:hypothetical protein